MNDLSRAELAVANARMAAFELVYEVETTMKWLDSLGAHLDSPTREEVARLEEVMAHRSEHVDGAIDAVKVAVTEALDVELVMHRRRMDP